MTLFLIIELIRLPPWSCFGLSTSSSTRPTCFLLKYFSEFLFTVFLFILKFLPGKWSLSRAIFDAVNTYALVISWSELFVQTTFGISYWTFCSCSVLWIWLFILSDRSRMNWHASKTLTTHLFDWPIYHKHFKVYGIFQLKNNSKHDGLDWSIYWAP